MKTEPVMLTMALRIVALSVLIHALTAGNAGAAAPTNFFKSNLIPSPNGTYTSPQAWNWYYASGVIISNAAQRLCTQSILPPIPGAPQTHNYSETLELEISMDSGITWQSVVITNMSVTRQIGWNSTSGGSSLYTNNWRAFNGSGSGLPAGVRIRQSTMSPSVGQTRITPTTGGYLISDFCDMYPELSTDNGLTWAPASSPCHWELKPDPALITPAPAPRSVLPMPNGQYISPTAWWQLYASGIVIKDIQQKLFTGWSDPPAFKAGQTQTFALLTDCQLSTDGGLHFAAARAPTTMTLSITNKREFMSRSTYEVEVTQLDLAGGDLPAGVMIRESPTKQSKGGISSLAGGGGGGAGGGAAIGSFFDIFTEVSVDGGATWAAATNGPAHVELRRIWPACNFINNLLPPPTGQYLCPQQWSAYYASGIVLTNLVHRTLSQAVTPPLSGFALSHSFGSQVEFDASYDGGLTYSHVVAPATNTMQIIGRLGGDGVTDYYDTEMVQFDIAGGGLPTNVHIRESPTKASLGRTTSSAVPAGGYLIDSFFDIFTEVSTDGGLTWLPSVAGPMTLVLQSQTIIAPGTIAIQHSGPNVVLNWTNAAFGLQSAPAITGTFTNIPGATSPYTNAITSGEQFYRLFKP